GDERLDRRAARVFRVERPLPGLLDVPDESERPVPVSQQPLRQAGDEVLGRQLLAGRAFVMREVVERWRAAAEAGEVEADQAAEQCIGRDVAGGEALALLDQHATAGPVGAHELALELLLDLMAAREADAMSDGQEERRRIVASHQATEPLL